MQTCLLMRTWNNALDEKIVQVIEKNDGKTYFYHLEKELGISRKTLNEHLKKLEAQETIQKDENPQIGKKRYIRLTPKAILKKSLDILEGVKPKNVTMRHKRLVMLIVGLICQTYVGHVRRDGSVLYDPPPPVHLTSNIGSKYPGLSIKDLKNENFYAYVNDFSYEEITESIGKLNNVKVASVTFTEEIRYVFDPQYEKLIPFVNTCFHILGILLTNMTHKWFLKKKPTTEEINWFTLIVGKKQVRLFFTTLEEERKLVPERRRRDYEHDFGKCDYVEAILKTPIINKQFIKDNELTIKRQTEELEKNYHDIKTTFPVFYELMKEMICPSFIH